MTIPDYKPIRQFESRQFEHGAHFEYISLFKSLMELMPSLPLTRLGNQGIYFQEEKRREPLSNNYPKEKRKSRQIISVKDINKNQHQLSFHTVNPSSRRTSKSKPKILLMKQNVKKMSINRKTIFPLILNTERSLTHISLSNTHLPLFSPAKVKTARNNEN